MSGRSKGSGSERTRYLRQHVDIYHTRNYSNSAFTKYYNHKIKPLFNFCLGFDFSILYHCVDGQCASHLLKIVSRKHNKRNILTSEYEMILDIVVNDQNIIFPLPWSLGYSYVSFSWHI